MSGKKSMIAIALLLAISILALLLEPGGIAHSESSRNNQSELIRNSQCTCLAN